MDDFSGIVIKGLLKSNPPCPIVLNDSRVDD
jgi:hypothetical protein